MLSKAGQVEEKVNEIGVDLLSVLISNKRLEEVHFVKLVRTSRNRLGLPKTYVLPLLVLVFAHSLVLLFHMALV